MQVGMANTTPLKLIESRQESSAKTESFANYKPF